MYGCVVRYSTERWVVVVHASQLCSPSDTQVFFHTSCSRCFLADVPLDLQSAVGCDCLSLLFGCFIFNYGSVCSRIEAATFRHARRRII